MSNPKDLVGAKKAPMDLVPAAGAIMSAPAHKNGADKYGPFNWRKNPVQMMTYLAAMRRHMDALIDGQDLAEDTGIHHLSHILAGANILADAMGLGNLIDNRPPKGPAADMLREQDHSAPPVVDSILPAMFKADPGWFNCGDPECGACPRPSDDEHHALMKARRETVAAARADETKPTTVFWCGHKWGEEPITDESKGPLCGTTIHWSRVSGVADTTPFREAAAMVPAELAVCEDSGNHIPGRHLLTCPDFS